MGDYQKNKESVSLKEETRSNGEDSLPILALEDYDIPEEEEETVENTVGGSVRYAFVGSGQGGGRLAEAFYSLGYNKTICDYINQNYSSSNHCYSICFLISFAFFLPKGFGPNMPNFCY